MVLMKTYLLIWVEFKTNHVDSLMRRGLDATMLFNKCEQDSLHAKQRGCDNLFSFSLPKLPRRKEVDRVTKQRQEVLKLQLPVKTRVVFPQTET